MDILKNSNDNSENDLTSFEISSPSVDPLNNSNTDKINDLSTNILSKISNQIDETQPFDYPPLSDQEIKDGSLLENLSLEKMPYLEDTVRQSKISLIKSMANFLGGGSVTGGEGKNKLDGTNAKKNFILWDWLFKDLVNEKNKKIGELPTIEKIAENITHLKEYATDLEAIGNDHKHNYKELNAKALKYTQKIKDLKVGESLPLYGGYGNFNNGGHALIYEFSRTSKDLFDITIITSTGFQLADHATIDNKERVNPRVLFQNVPASTLFISQDDNRTSYAFIQAMMELQVLGSWDTNRTVEEEDILEIFELFIPFMQPSKDLRNTEYGYVTGQRAGTCVPSSTKQWIRKQVGSTEAYKKLIHHCKLKMMVATYRELSDVVDENSEEGQLARTLLKSVAKNLFRGVTKLIKGVHLNKPLIDEESAHKTQATCLDLLQKIDDIEKEILAKTLQETKALKIDSNKNDGEVKREKLISEMSPTELKPNLYITMISVPTTLEKINKPSDALELINSLLSDHLHTRLKEEVRVLEIDELIEALPLPKLPETEKPTNGFWVEGLTDPFWTQIPVDKVDSYLKAIEQLTKLYSDLNKGISSESLLNHPYLPKVHASLLTLYTLTHYLALRSELSLKKLPSYKNSLLGQYSSPNFADCTLYEQHHGLIYLGTAAYERIKFSMEYFNAFNKQAKKPPLFQNGGNSDIINWDVGNETMGDFWKELHDRDPLINKKAEEIYPTLINWHQKNQVGTTPWCTYSYEQIQDHYNSEMNNYKEKLKEYNKKLKEHQNTKSRDYYFGYQSYYPEIPEEPKRYVNPSDIAKIIGLLEISDSSISGSLLSQDFEIRNNKYNYKHIHILRRMHYLVSFPMKNDQWCTTFSCEVSKPVWNGSKLQIKKSQLAIGCSTKQSCPPKSFRGIKEYHYKLLAQVTEIRRHESAWKNQTSEGRILVGSYSTQFLAPLTKKLIRILPEWELTPHQILYELENHLEDLKDLSLQKFLLRVIFRPPILKNTNEIRLGTGELVVKDEALAKAFHHFIDKNLTYFSNQQSEKKVDETLFFFSLAFYLCTYFKDAKNTPQLKKFDQIPLINDWIKEEKKAENQAILHLYRVLFYSLKSPEDLSEQDLSDLFQSWISYHFHPTDENKITPMDFSWAKNFIFDLCGKVLFPMLKKNEKTRNLICNGILDRLGLDSYQGTLCWQPTKNYPNVFEGCPSGKKDPVQWIDLAGALVYSPTGKIGCFKTENPAWMTNSSFKDVFGDNTTFNYLCLGGNNYSFNHPTFGTIQLLQKQTISLYGFSRSPSSDYGVQRKFPNDSQWYEHKDTSFFKEGVLKDKYTFWIPTETPPSILFEVEKISITGYLATREGGKRQLAITDKGKILEVDSETGKPYEGSRYIEISDANDFPEIDSPSNILIYRNASTKKVEKLHFPRYSSMRDQTLQFFSSEKGLTWSENNSFVLSENMPSGYLGTLHKNALYLSSTKEESQGKLLVPFQNIKTSKTPIANGSFDINAKTSPWCDESNKKGSIKYFVYDVEGGVIKPTNIETRLFLAYIELSQKNYSRAMFLLNQMKPCEEISPMSLTILEMFEEMPLGCDDPNEKMVHLKAVALKIKHLDSQIKKNKEISIDPKPEYLSSTKSLWGMMEMIADSLNSINNISIACRLSIEEQINVISKVLVDAQLCKGALCKDPQIAKEFESIRNKIDRRLRILNRIRTKDPSIEETYSQGYRIVPKSTSGRYRDFTRNNSDFPNQKTATGYLENKYHPTKKNTAISEMNRDFSWLLNPEKSGEKDLHIFTRSITKHSHIGKNGKLFLEVVRLVHKGTESEKREMMFRLRLWRLHSPDSATHELEVMMAMIYGTTKCPSFNNFGNDMDLAAIFLTNIRIYSYPTLSQIDAFIRGEVISYEKPKKTETHYPVLKPSVFDIRHVTLEDFGENKLPLKPTLKQENEKRWQKLSTWKALYAEEEKYPKVEGGKDFSLDFDDHLLKEEEKHYEKALRNNLESLREDYKEGKNQNNLERATKIPNTIAEKIHDEAVERIEQINRQLRKKTETLLREKANRRHSDTGKRLAEIGSVGGGVTKDPSFLDCIDGLLSLDQRHYKLLNENLTAEEMEEVAELTLEIEDLKSERLHLKRIADVCSKIKNTSTNPITHEHACLKLDHELSAKYDGFSTFDNDTQVILRVFAGRTGMIPHQKQLDILRKMIKPHKNDPQRFRDLVLQLIMGGGKTKVIAALFLYIAAKRNERLALFVVPDPLFEVVKANLGEDFFNAFHKHLQAIRIDRDDLTLPKIKQILEQIKQAKKKQEPILLTSHTLQTFQLEFLACNKQQLKQKYDTNSLLFEKMGLLADICEELGASADCLLDEEHEILDSNKELNFPEGDITPISSMDNGLLQAIYQGALINKNLIVETLDEKRSVPSIVRLEENEQSQMDTGVYKKHVLPVVAKYLTEYYAPLKDTISSLQGPSLVRYISGQMPPEIQDLAEMKNIPIDEKTLKEKFPLWKWEDYGDIGKIKDDIALLKLLAEWGGSDNKRFREHANLIALAKHLLLDLTPETLKSSGKKNYGIDPKVETLKIIPYESANDPATTQVDYYLEEACYYYQWAAAFPITEKDVLEYGLMAKDQADIYMKKNDELFDETVEYQLFGELFDFSLNDLKNEEKRKKGTEFASKNTHFKLEMVYEIIRKRVGSRKERLTSNNMTLTDLVSSMIAMSGSTNNHEGLKRSLANRFMPDTGVDGKILHKLSERAKDVRIHEVELSSIENFLDKIFKDHPTPEKIRGLIETAGIFKNFKDYQNNKAIAEQIMLYFSKKQKEQEENNTNLVNAKIKGVLFFDKDPKGNNCLYVWEKDKGARMLIGTSIAALRDQGLEPEDYFVFYGQANITGTDIWQVPDAINIATFDEKTILNCFEQGTMRLRQFLYSQNIELAVTKETRRILVNEGKSLEDFILSAQKAQTLKNSKDMIRYFRQQIDHIFYRQAVQALFKAVRNKDKNLKEIIAIYEPFFVTKTTGSHYERFGSLNRMTDTKEMLRDHLKRKMKIFKECVKDSNVIENVEKNKLIESVKNEEKQFLEHLEKATCLPEKCENSSSSIGVQQTVQTQTQTQTKTETETLTEVETETKLELKCYQNNRNEDLRKEKGVSQEMLIKMINALKTDTKDEEIIPLKEQLSKYPYSYGNTKLPYEKVFDAPIYGTDAYFYMLKGKPLVPIFSEKYQKPPKQILAVNTEKGMRWLLLSEHEAGDVKKLLETLYKDENCKDVSGVWLLQPNGKPVHKRKDKEKFPRTQEDVVRGLLEINAFAGHADYLQRNSSEFGAWLSSESELKIRFLKLKALGNDLFNKNNRQHNALMSSLITMQVEDQDVKNVVSTAFKRRLEVEMNQKGTLHCDPIKVQTLPNKKIKKLNISLVPHLTEKQMPYIEPFQVPYLTEKQISWLPPGKIPFLKLPEQIKVLTEEQSKYLVEKQQELIPHLNKDFYKNFDQGWQISNIHVKHLDKIKEESLCFLSKKQVKQFTPEMFKFLAKNPKQFSWVQSSLIDKIPNEHLDQVCEEQIQEITDKNSIQTMEQLAKENGVKAGKWTSYISPEQVCLINFDKQIHYLNKTQQLRKIPKEYLSKLLPAQISLLSKEQLLELKELKLKEWTDCQKIITKAQVATFDDPKYFDLLNEEQIKDFVDQKLLKFLTAKWQIQACHEDLIKYLDNTQLAEVSDAQVPHLLKEQLIELKKRYTIPWHSGQKCITEKQIDTFDNSTYFELLNGEQLKALQPKNLAYLSLTQLVNVRDLKGQGWSLEDQTAIQKASKWNLDFKAKRHLLPDIYLKLVKPSEVPLLTKDLLNELYVLKQDNWHVLQESISEEQIQQFDKTEDFEMLRDDQYPHVKPDQVCHLSLDQLLKLHMRKYYTDKWYPYKGKVANNLIPAFTSQKHFDFLKSEQFQFVIPEQVSLMTKDHLLSLHYEKINDHWSTYQENISAAQINTFDHSKYFNLLTTSQFKDVKSNQVPYLDRPADVQKCEGNTKLFKKLKDDQISMVAARQIKYLDDTQLCFIKRKNQDLIQAVPYAKVEYLVRDQLRARSWKQWTIYTIGVITLGLVCSVVAIVARLILVPYLLCKVYPRLGNWIFKKVDANPRRLYRYVREYTLPTKRM